MATYTDQQLQTLKDALASGTLRVRFADREITYRSVDELKAAISAVEIELAKNSGALPNRQIRVYTEKGFKSRGWPRRY